ncbi:MAG TPA: ABC transporter ATP-binding protein [Cyanobacteria bacterium UBA11149]|nr:ABC transporter ATP-binding protein [Cyanobacteria bacterium UBA11367]HBE56171.1 ABC transporter ATP-binding protein [Cyanobacteria bacterium UBA11366]HBK62192.1 ABC transporter ATP-binding protein [Cyanobacteria bacterium UBA11166]HBR73899.1 ABC transporter ATP-binding protein [Cyanobacteria bacterium UBA11159]HBS70216.1 ABC transporter ATP-binding protein [Cyanobacteria bacterium UBA11153]HBW90849.1 ABC transporter ATP-binding protein [Cyanobacteria bacterium UBA11149]HCA96343.1 ABC tran
MGFILSKPIWNLLKTTKFWRNNSFILREFKQFRRIAILAVIYTLLAAIFEGFDVGFILSFLQSFTNPDAPPIQTGIEWFDIWILGVNAPSTERLYRVSALILLMTWLRCGFTYLGQVYSKIAQIELVDGLRKRLFEQLQGLSLSYFSQTRSGELINSLTTEIEQIKQAFDIVSVLVARGSTLLAYAVSIVLISWQMTIVSLMLFSLQAVGLSTLITKVREASFERSKANGLFVGTSVEFINGIRTVQAFSTQNFERNKFYNASLGIVNASRKIVSVSSLVVPISEGVAITIIMGMMVLSFTTFIPNGQLQPASLLTFLFVLFRLMPIVRQVNNARTKMGDFQGALSNIKELLRTDDKVYFQDGEIKFQQLQKEIEFEYVNFGYDENNLVLKDINLKIERGQTTALVGASGSGKTTLADLIPRFYDPTGGKILIDGVDLREFQIDSVRRKMAIVSQDTFIFNTSVRNNIAYGTEAADDREIQEAARLANALEFIEEMPEGFDTILGDRGVRLSGGQRQRIAIARALLRNPDILILDEATSALDSVSERLIQESLEKLSFGRTVIAIAHRLSTIASADKVVVLNRGQIVEQGGYQELLQLRGKLWQYHQMQSSSEEKY